MFHVVPGPLPCLLHPSDLLEVDPLLLAPPPAICPQIGLQSVYIIDAGETALVEGLRVAPWERGKGVAGVLQRFCSAMVKEKHPEVKVSRLTRDDKLGPKDLRKYRIIAKQVKGHPALEQPVPSGGGRLRRGAGPSIPKRWGSVPEPAGPRTGGCRNLGREGAGRLPQLRART